MYFLTLGCREDSSRMKITVEPIVFMYNAAYTVQLSLQQDFIFARLCNEHYTAKMCDNWWMEKRVEWVERAAVRRVMWMSVTAGYSQKLVMLTPFFGSLALSLVCLVVAAVPSASLDLLYVGAAINGAAGGFVVFKASVSTYIIGISAAEEWTDRLSIVESMLFLGSAVGPLGLQLLILYCTTYHSLLFLGCESVIVMAIIYIIFLLPDHKSSQQKINSLRTDNNNTGTINNNTGSVNNNTGSVNNNTGSVNNNTGSVNNNTGSVNTTTGSVNNIGTVNNNNGTVNNNTGTINNNTGTINNTRTINNNTGSVNTTTNYNTFSPSNHQNTNIHPSSSYSTQCVVGLKALFLGLSNAFSATFRRRAAGVRVAIVALLMADFFIAIVFAAEFDLLYLYMQDRFGLTLPEYSRYLGIKNIVNGISLLIILPSMRRIFGLSDVALGILGGVSRVAAFCLLGWTSSGSLVYLVPFLDIFGQYLFVVLRSVISSLVEKEEQGRVMTIVSAMAQLSLLMGSLIFDMLYPIFVSINYPGVTFLLAAGCLGTSTLILIYVNWHLKRIKKCEELRPLIQPVD
ncbi:uncharacterized protein LOC122253513 isoform X2 [Penaeus japonicus]|uniref:uncharacterized protein LOC122253513 isoform X2 n=1 Tax=Penaeus japonicus TaxID=27405 RepID=UPI001C70F4C8|nr:uncharacterized protein LOC122253513 isoform X2 [Penaeus japonicus]